MKTNVAIHSELVKEVAKAYHTRAKNIDIEKVLRDHIRMSEQLQSLQKLGAIEWRGDYDYEAVRSRS